METKFITFMTLLIMYFNPILCFGHTYNVVYQRSTNDETITSMLPAMGLTSGYAVFSSNGSVTNSGSTFITGNIGTNVGKITGFNVLNVKGNIHSVPDSATDMCAADLFALYNSLNQMPVNVELQNPSLFGHNLILTPQTYHLNATTILTDTLYINGLGDSNAVFVIKINGALTSASNSRVILINGAQSKNVFWKIEGAVTLNDQSTFRGIVVANNGAIILKSRVMLEGAAFTTDGTISMAANTVIMPTGFSSTEAENIETHNPGVALVIAPNPFGAYTTINLKNDSKYVNCSFKIYNSNGIEVINIPVNKQVITFDTSRLHSGTYFYKLTDNNKIIQSGKLISQL